MAHFDKITENQGDFSEKNADYPELMFLSNDGLKKDFCEDFLSVRSMITGILSCLKILRAVTG
jgi:hypothetical protein